MSMKIIDTHSHIGYCRVFDLEVSEEALIKAMNENNIQASIVQPFPGAPNPIETHDLIEELSRKYPKRIYGLINLNPHVEEDVYIKNVEKYIKLGFVGIKVHTIGHAIHPLVKDAEKIWIAAKKFNVPLMVHSGLGIPFALPSNVVPRAEEYPEVPIILAHAGFGFYSGEALLLAKKYENIYLETSWTSNLDLLPMVQSIPDKVLFGSDVPENISVELSKIKSLNLPESVLQKVLCDNALKLFKKITI